MLLLLDLSGSYPVSGVGATSMSITRTVIEAVAAFGTIAVAVLAVWGEWFRSMLAAPRIEIQDHNLRGTVTAFTGGSRVIYYHLKVVNKRSWAVAQNCRVILSGIHRRGPNQQFQPVLIAVPQQFVWSNPQLTPIAVDLGGEQVVDFGRVQEGSDRFEPVLYLYPNDFLGYVRLNEAVRYRLQVVAGGRSVGRPYIYEVAWNGKWNANLDAMTQNLTIRRVS